MVSTPVNTHRAQYGQIYRDKKQEDDEVKVTIWQRNEMSDYVMHAMLAYTTGGWLAPRWEQVR